jgi:Prophage protein (DUF1660)
MIERMFCALLGHKYVVQKVFSSTSRKLGCTRCFREWGMHDPTKSLVPWDKDLKEFYRFMGQLNETKLEEMNNGN